MCYFEYWKTPNKYKNTVLSKIFAGKESFPSNLCLVPYKFSDSRPEENFSPWIKKCFYSSSMGK